MSATNDERSDAARAGQGRPAAFIDRDGTIVAERRYLNDPEDVELVPGVPHALRSLRGAGYALVVVTNQSGIARGLYTAADFRAVQQRLESILEREGIRLDGVYHCPHHPDFTGRCECRKPAVGLYREAVAALDLDPARSLFVGDRLKDVEPARVFGGRGILVRTGYGADEETRAPDDVVVLDDLGAVAEFAVDRARG